ncbi:MAG: hypothetical protein Q4P06_02250 [Actinomycetaceae bacterium]|nr:hypothetical protein [Actinomycetaceae bacterium]
MNEPTCPVTGRALPDGYYLHPATREDFERALARLSIVFTALKEYQLGLTAPWESEVKTQPSNQIILREVETIDALIKRVESAMDTISALFKGRNDFFKHLTYKTKYPGKLPYLIFPLRLAYDHLDELLRTDHAPGLYHDIVEATNEAERILDNRNAPTLPAVCYICAEFTPTSRKQEETKCSGCGAMFDTEIGLQAAQQRALGVIGMAHLARKYRR